MDMQMPLLLAVMAITAMYTYGIQSQRRRKNCVIVITMILALFSGLRSWWMGDLIKYYTQYRACNGSEWYATITSGTENFGLRYFFHYAGAIGISYDNCILIIACFVAITLGLIVYRYSPSPFWSYVMYIAMGFYMFTYSGLKQSVAMGFLILAAMAMFEGKFWKYLVFTFLGGIFHAPAFIFLAAYPFCRQRLGRRYVVVLIALVAALFLFRTQIVNFMNEIYYEEADSFTDTNEVGGRFIMMVLIMILGVILRPLHNWDKVYLQVFNLMILAASLQTMSVFGNVFTRLADYYYQFVVLYMPMIMQTGRSQAKEMPEYRKEIRYWHPHNYALLSIAVIAFALWFYGNQLEGGYPIMKDFVFRWEIDPYSLYGS
jgi:transmembrane protein EpsG